MSECPKCGNRAISGPRYDRSLDELFYTCVTCMYQESRPPLDRQREPSDALSKALDRIKDRSR